MRGFPLQYVVLPSHHCGLVLNTAEVSRAVQFSEKCIAATVRSQTLPLETMSGTWVGLPQAGSGYRACVEGSASTLPSICFYMLHLFAPRSTVAKPGMFLSFPLDLLNAVWTKGPAYVVTTSP